MRRRTFRYLGYGIATLAALVLALNFFLAPRGAQVVVFKPAAKECFAQADWKACVYRAPQGTNGEVAYFLHGRGLDEQIWNDDTFYTAQIQAQWERTRTLPPTIVTVSFGRFWLLAPKGEAPRTGLLATFLDGVIPEVERRIGVPPSRMLVGESMGGVNSLIAGLSAPEKFRKVVSICPPIYTITPFIPLRDMFTFFRRTGADPRTLLGVLGGAKLYAKDEAEWDRVAPLKLLDAADPKRTPELYVACGLYDRYGNYEGVTEFVRRAEARGFRIQWRPLYGNHCVVDVASAAEAIADFTTSRSGAKNR